MGRLSALPVYWTGSKLKINSSTRFGDRLFGFLHSYRSDCLLLSGIKSYENFPSRVFRGFGCSRTERRKGGCPPIKKFFLFVSWWTSIHPTPRPVLCIPAAIELFHLLIFGKFLAHLFSPPVARPPGDIAARYYRPFLRPNGDGQSVDCEETINRLICLSVARTSNPNIRKSLDTRVCSVGYPADDACQRMAASNRSAAGVSLHCFSRWTMARTVQ